MRSPRAAEEAATRLGASIPREALADAGLTDERIFLFTARSPAPPRAARPDEHIEVVPTLLAEAYRMADAGEILDAGTLVALYRFRSRAGR